MLGCFLLTKRTQHKRPFQALPLLQCVSHRKLGTCFLLRLHHILTLQPHLDLHVVAKLPVLVVLSTDTRPPNIDATAEPSAAGFLVLPLKCPGRGGGGACPGCFFSSSERRLRTWYLAKKVTNPKKMSFRTSPIVATQVFSPSCSIWI